MTDNNIKIWLDLSLDSPLLLDEHSINEILEDNYTRDAEDWENEEDFAEYVLSTMYAYIDHYVYDIVESWEEELTVENISLDYYPNNKKIIRELARNFYKKFHK